MESFMGSMVKIFTSMVLVLSISLAVPAYAQQGYGYSAGAYSELETKRTYLQRASDWVATVGKSKKEKILIRSRRRAARKMANTQKEIARKKKEIEKKKKKARQQFKEREKRTK